ncbi:MAG: hypothetical protein ACHRXM_31510 [Isosphaerales bacterium]
MKTMTVQVEVTADRMLKVEVPCDLPPGQVEVVLTIQPHRPLPLPGSIDWGQLSGPGREVWQGVDATSDPRELRADRERAK